MANPKCETDCRENLLGKISGKVGWKTVLGLFGIAMLVFGFFWNGYRGSQGEAKTERIENKTMIGENRYTLGIITNELGNIKETQKTLQNQGHITITGQLKILEALRRLEEKQSDDR